jgi:peptidoglycan-associated lipoprotein
LLKDNPNIKIELSSHTDSRAEDAFNLDLSEKRAQSAVRYLIQKGISQNRLVAKGYGETQLINGCTNDVECTEVEHQKNRRTEFKVIEYRNN